MHEPAVKNLINESLARLSLRDRLEDIVRELQLVHNMVIGVHRPFRAIVFIIESCQIIVKGVPTPITEILNG